MCVSGLWGTARLEGRDRTSAWSGAEERPLTSRRPLFLTSPEEAPFDYRGSEHTSLRMWEKAAVYAWETLGIGFLRVEECFWCSLNVWE